MSPDVYVSTGQGILGNNMFAYCNNNPVMYTDKTGTKTIGILLSGNVVCGLGASFSVGIVIDDKLNFDIQWAYSLPKTKEVVHVGGLGAGFGAVFQYTASETVYDLYGVSTAIGGSVGIVGFDFLSPTVANDFETDFNGFQISLAKSIGIDPHIVQSKNQSLIKNTTQTSNIMLTQQEIKRYTIMEKKMFGGH